MTVLDWAIVAFTFALALWGYRQGLIVGALTLVGFGAGAFLGSRIGPQVLSQGHDSPYAPLCGAIGALMVGALAAVAAEGIALALRRRVVRHPFIHRADGAGGAVLIGALALGLAWIFGVVALHAPGTTQLRADVQNSVILRELDQVMPPTGSVLDALDRVDPAPSVSGPATPTRRPDPAIAADPAVLSAGGSVVRVLSTACGLGVEGSGWAVQPDLIVTNAHVVAGADDTTVTTQSGVELDATAVYYEPEDDLALLRIDGSLPTLPISPGSHQGEPAAVLGYPENGPYTVTLARIGETRSTISENSYGNGPIERTITSLGGDVRSGNSGGPLLDRQGDVAGVVFAATTSGPAGGFAVPAEQVRAAIPQASTAAVGTGPCTR
ncbi:MAG TPA: MarP family serine protease [Solirubrobacterales bacterium]|nr:MarP family serine protease [Solirubrobacterales bacterium]